MKGFLPDENIPRNVTFIPVLPVSHASDLGVSVSDTMIWRHALENDFVNVSKDTDFSHREHDRIAAAVRGASAIWKSAQAGFSRAAKTAVATASRRCCRITSW